MAEQYLKTVSLSVVLFFLLPSIKAGKITIDNFTRCPRGLMFQGQQLGVRNGRSGLHCASQCSQSPDCLGVNVCPTGSSVVECTLISDHNPDGCANLDDATTSQCYFMQRPEAVEETTVHPTTEVTTTRVETTELVCQNGGTPKTDHCTCPKEYGGRLCERLVRDCTEVFENGYTESQYDGMYNIQPITSTSPFQVRCQFAWGVGITYLMYRPNWSDFNKNWQDMKDGFGYASSQNYFIGLEKMHQFLTQGGYEMHMYFTHSSGAGSALYDNFTVASETDLYQVTYDQFRTSSDRPADDGFSPVQPVVFSAAGQDTNGCASSNGASGWYGADCSTISGLFAPTLTWPVNGQLKSLYIMEFNLVRMTPFYE